MGPNEAAFQAFRINPAVLAKAALHAYAQLRLDVILLASDTPSRNAVTQIANKVHKELAENIGVDVGTLTVVMAQLFLLDSLDLMDQVDGGEDSSG